MSFQDKKRSLPGSTDTVSIQVASEASVAKNPFRILSIFLSSASLGLVFISIKMHSTLMFALLANFLKTLKTAFPFFPSLLLLDNLYRNSYIVDLAKKNNNAKKHVRLYYDPPTCITVSRCCWVFCRGPSQSIFLFSPRVMERMSNSFALNNKCGWELGALLLDPKT